jgi:photosystem II stability/assembly factor-like uncharacterized protein
MRSIFLLPLAAIVLAGCGGSSSSAPPTAVPALNHVHAIAILPNDPGALYMGSHYHLYKTANGGKSWTPLSKQMMLSLALDTRRPTTLFAASLQRGLVRSTDGGKHWTPAAPGIPKGNITGVVMDPASQVVFAYGAGVYRSADGTRWKRSLASQSVHSVAVGTGGSVYTATDNGLFVSRNDGLHWSAIAVTANEPVVQVAAAGSTGYAVTPVSILKTTDGGRAWHRLGSAPTGVEFIGISPSDPREIFAEVGGSGFKASYDGGLTWHNANSGIHDRDFNAATIRVAPSSPNIVYTGAWGLHFYASHDAGHHWTQTATLTR